jgi:hypothetical protein
MTRFVVLLAVAVLTAATASIARADGDPASDYLLVQKVFLSYELSSQPQQEHALTKLVAQVNKQGFAIRVAVISSTYDLGSVTVLWRKPQTYARFLGAELEFVYRQRLLIVMPNGFGFNWPKHSAKAGYAVLAKLHVGRGAAGQLAAATAAVRALAKAG